MVERQSVPQTIPTPKAPPEPDTFVHPEWRRGDPTRQGPFAPTKDKVVPPTQAPPTPPTPTRGN